MILNSMIKAVRQQDRSVVFTELLVLIIGMVRAFQGDRGWDERAGR